MSDRAADIIKISAIITAITRWAGAIAEAEGFVIPEDWRPYWRFAVFALSAFMGVAEGLGLWYIMRAWRDTRADSPQSRTLIKLIILTGIVFVVVQTPWLVAQTLKTDVSAILSGIGVWIWNTFVACSAFVIAGAVGYAQKRVPYASMQKQSIANAMLVTSTKTHPCKQCDFVGKSPGDLAAHVRWKHKQPVTTSANGNSAMPVRQEESNNNHEV